MMCYTVAVLLISLLLKESMSFNITWEEYITMFPGLKIHKLSRGYFIDNVKTILFENRRNNNFKLGLTPFLHLSHDEWKTYFNPLSSSILTPSLTPSSQPSLTPSSQPSLTPSSQQNNTETKEDLNLVNGEESFSWVSKGMTTPVKDQGQAGTCYQHAAIETIETAYAIKTGKLLKLSVQQGVDCSRMNNGVNGGLPDYSYKYAKQTPQCYEEDYPYTSGSTGKESKCHSCNGAVPTLNTYIDVKDGDESSMLKYLSVGSLAVGIKADDKQFQLYKSGVLDYDCDSSSKSIDHAVVVEGYGVENGIPYWLVRNSWSTVWGESGYIKMKRNVCMCGICHMASLPQF